MDPIEEIINVNIPNPNPNLVQQPNPVAPRISIVNTIEAQHLRTYKEENPELYDMLNDAYKQNLPPYTTCLLYTSPSPRDKRQSRMPSSA